MTQKQWIDSLWDVWCAVSIIGIWPRFIEPQLLATTRLNLPLSRLPPSLEGTKIIHFSDLHWAEGFSSSLSNRILRQVNTFNPDLILFTGDFINRSILHERPQLIDWLNRFEAKAGCFAILGNHDYEKFITLNQNGEYDVDRKSSQSSIKKSLSRIFKPPIPPTGKISQAAIETEQHRELIDLLQKTPFTLLDNRSQLIPCRGGYLNICGLGEFSAGRCHPDIAFKDYDRNYPGIVLTHNPDSIPLLQNYPGDLVLAGHTHGGQINIPFLWNRITRMKEKQFKRGLKRVNDKWAYINRGISGSMKFRLFSIPEITCITLRGNHG